MTQAKLDKLCSVWARRLRLQDWIVSLVRGLVGRLPIGLLVKLGLATLFRPRTRHWGAARMAIEEYVHERKAADLRALGLDARGAER